MHGYYSVVIISLLLGLLASALVNSRMRKYSRIASSLGMTGEQIAYKMLSDNGVSDVRVLRGREGQDHFDPRSNTISLSPSNFNSTSLTAVATACHEAGHALQYAKNYKPLFIRASLVPAVNFCSNAWIFIFLIGVFANIAGATMLACAIYAVVVLFQVITLPVEFNASSRGLDYMRSLGLSSGELSASSKLLRACALTYVVAAVASAIQLLWIFSSSER